MTWAAHAGTAQAARCLAQTCLALQALPPAMPALPPGMPFPQAGQPQASRLVLPLVSGQARLAIASRASIAAGHLLYGPLTYRPCSRCRQGALLSPVQPHQKPFLKSVLSLSFLFTALYIPLQSFATDRSYPFARRAVLQGRAGLRQAAPERTGRTAAQRTHFASSHRQAAT